MLALLFLPFYFLLNCYLCRVLITYLCACSQFFGKRFPRFVFYLLYSFFASSFLIGFLLSSGNFQRFFKVVGNSFLGVLIYGVLAILVVKIGWFLWCRFRHVTSYQPSLKQVVLGGSCCLFLIYAISVAGVIHAKPLTLTSYHLTVPKKAKTASMKIALVSDLHLGYTTSYRQIAQMVAMINEQQVDAVVIAGDIFDNNYEAIANPQSFQQLFLGLQSRYGVYAVNGNHDVKEKELAGFTFPQVTPPISDQRMNAFLERSGITLLQDQYVLLPNDVYLYGRVDAKKKGRARTRKTASQITSVLDSNKPLIVIDHEPNELSALAEALVDVTLSGHTHDGQLFPLNLLINIFYENSYGYQQNKSMHSIVTSGVGLFGPNMRVFTNAEVCLVTIDFSMD